MERLRGHLEIPTDVVFEVLDGEAVVLNLKTGVYYSLNPVGTRIWQLIEERRELRAIRDAMVQEYEVEAPVLEADLKEFISKLGQKGLLCVGEGEL